MKDITIIITGKNGQVVEIDLEAQPVELAQLMHEHEWFRNVILESINTYAERYISPLEFVRFLSERKN